MHAGPEGDHPEREVRSIAGFWSATVSNFAAGLLVLVVAAGVAYVLQVWRKRRSPERTFVRRLLAEQKPRPLRCRLSGACSAGTKESGCLGHQLA
jgi:hypothetical protein